MTQPDSSFRTHMMPTAEDWDSRYAGDELVWTGTPNQALREEIATLSPGHVLNLAAGEGRNSIWLAEQGWTVSAIDFSPAAMGKARRFAEERGVSESIDFIVADLRDSGGVTIKADLVVIVYLHLPWSSLAPIFAQSCGAVRPGGRLLVVGHDSENNTHGQGGPQNPKLLHFPELILNALCQNMRVEKATKVSRFVSRRSANEIAVDCLVRARRDDDQVCRPDRSLFGRVTS